MQKDEVELTNNPEILNKFLNYIESDTFSCIGAKTAAAMGSLIHRDCCKNNNVSLEDVYGYLRQFISLREQLSKTNSTFVLTFSDKYCSDEAEFEIFLWDTLTKLSKIDMECGFLWSEECSSDPQSPQFSFSLGGEPFFIVGLHPKATRISRRSPYPSIVFNSHRQFHYLKELGTFEKMQKEIRRREMVIQGDLNPNLSNFGEESEARQYAGNITTKEWVCPFKKKL
ncbi:MULTISPECIES: guanitoxin biosynthesis heme-dependent pre-guanitoxin N-hydroxylase GntA [Dickeya]|uniref:guanitoxin biosynthesis heme-dependent pre-guanitoxin N-hydroxylase GntA n=1 Tax=Dickeya TaxID=204037 RepID=UPI0003733F18|nr:MULTISPECIES: guanitoxin biosynthesis heme-dependent pre-guanitoxin N-hydroxylase GntA [Dickeya]AJC65877.1 hypothetical protein W909_07285 [Dickeya zeae EC1]